MKAETPVRPRVGLIVPGFIAPDDGGAASFRIPALVDRVASLTTWAEVDVVTLRYPAEVARYAMAGATIEAMGGGDKKGLRRLFWLRRAARRICTLAHERRWQLIHGLWADEPGALAVYVAARLRVPSLVSVMGGELCALGDIDYGGALRPINKRLVRYALRGARCVTAGSTQLATALSAAGVVPTRQVLLPLGVEHRRLEESPLRPGDRRDLVAVGSLVPVKDPLTTLRGFAASRAAAATSTRLLWVGDGPLCAAMLGEAERLGVAGRVTLLGNLPPDEVGGVLRGAALFVHSARHEAQGMALLEAASLGLPIITTAVGVAADELRAGCRTFSMGDASAMARAVDEVLGSLEVRATLGAGARTAAAGFELDRTEAHLREVYSDLIVGHGTGPVTSPTAP